LSEYDFRIIHIKGKENALADGMSKLLMEAMEFGRPGKEESALEIMSANQPSNDKRWEYWLEDDWYTRVVYLKLHGKLRAEALERTAWQCGNVGLGRQPCIS